MALDLKEKFEAFVTLGPLRFPSVVLKDNELFTKVPMDIDT